MQQTTIGLLIYENVQPMDFIGPWEVLSFWKNILHAPINMYLISENGELVTCSNDITVKAHCNFTNAPQLDYLIIPGGRGRLEQVKNNKIISFIKKQAQHSKKVISVCTGMFLLHQAGLLKNKSATTYWPALAELKSFADVKVIEERIVKCGNIWTAGGVSSGIDLALELIAEIAGKEIAGEVQLLFEYFPNDTVYCSLDTVDKLPPYEGSKGIDELKLPEYIKKYIEEKK